MANTVIASTADAQMVDSPLWMQATGGDAAINYAGGDDRALLDTVYSTEGVTEAGGFKLSQRGAGANFSVDCAAGRATIIGDDGANQRKYVVISNGVVNIATPTAPGSGTRVHRVIARVRDKQVIGSGTYDWTLELLEDTGSGTPALPNSAINLGTVSIAAGQASVLNANITDTRALAALGSTRIVGRHRRTTNSTGTTSEVSVVRIDGMQVFAGHAYRVKLASAIFVSTVANDIVRAPVYYTTNGTSATTGSTLMGIIAQTDVENTSWVPVQPGELLYVPASTHLLSVLLTVARAAGTGTVSITAVSPNNPLDFYVEDLGTDPGDTGVNL